MTRDEMIAEIQAITGLTVCNDQIRMPSGHVQWKYTTAFVANCLATARRK